MRGYRWTVVGLMFVITVINYIDRSAIAYAIGPLQRLLHLDPAQVGLVLGAFGAGYTVTTFFGGIWVDRQGPRRVWSLSALVWSLSVAGTALAAGFAWLWGVRALLGLAEGPNFPSMNRVVGDWLAPRERAIALGWGLVGVPFALMIGAPLVSQLVVRVGWRAMFLILGALGLLWLPFWLAGMRDVPEEHPRVSRTELLHIRAGEPPEVSSRTRRARQLAEAGSPWRQLLTNPTLLANDWAFFVFGYLLFFFLGWLPTYLGTQYHLNLGRVGLFASLPWLFATVLLAATGYLSDLVLKRTGNLRYARSYPIWISLLLSGLSLLPVILVHRLEVAVLGISLAVGFGMAANSAYYAVNVDLAPSR
ncbi:MAG: MFS transporter, partial [Firmicutes bacterium]|nr:MFS transporter [Bacillota bacterium]